MKKVSLFLFLLTLSVCVQGYAQAVPPTDFFAGKWAVTVSGTPNGEAKFVADLTRKEGKLTGILKDESNANTTRPITKVEEGSDKLTFYFDSEQAADVAVELAKVDEDHLKGSVMNMFEATALRIKNK